MLFRHSPYHANPPRLSEQIFGSAQGSSMELRTGSIELMLSSVRTRLCQMLLASLLRCSTGWLVIGLLSGCCLSFVLQSQRILFPSHQHRLASRTTFVVSFHCTAPSSSNRFKSKSKEEMVHANAFAVLAAAATGIVAVRAAPQAPAAPAPPAVPSEDTSGQVNPAATW